MADESDPTDILRQAYGPDSRSTADVMGQYQAPPEPSWHDKYVKPWGSAALAQQEPNWFGKNVLSNIPPEAMLALSFLTRRPSSGGVAAASLGRQPELVAPAAPTSAREEWLASVRPGEYGAPRQEKGFSLSQNLYQDPDRFHYGIFNNGNLHGFMSGWIKDGKAVVGNIQGGEPHSLGLSGLRSIREDFGNDFPGIYEFGGKRVRMVDDPLSATREAAGWRDGNDFQRVRIPGRDQQ